MPRPEAARSDQTLSDTLSARSYLKLARGAQEDERTTSQSPPDRRVEEEAKSKSGRTLRPRKRPPPQSTKENPKHGLESRDLPSDRPAHKRRRPRLETEKDAAAIQERRMQIRRAQRTYRLKKETTIQTLETRVAVLEETLQNVADLVGSSRSDEADSFHLHRPGLDCLTQTRELVLAEIDRTRAAPVSCMGESNRDSEQTPGNSRDIFGYQVLHAWNGAEDRDSRLYSRLANKSRSYNSSPRPSRSTTPLLNRLGWF